MKGEIARGEGEIAAVEKFIKRERSPPSERLAVVPSTIDALVNWQREGICEIWIMTAVHLVTGKETVLVAWGVYSRQKEATLAALYESIVSQLLAHLPQDVANGLVGCVSDGEGKVPMIQREILDESGVPQPQMLTGFGKHVQEAAKVRRVALSGRDKGGSLDHDQQIKFNDGIVPAYNDFMAKIYVAKDSRPISGTPAPVMPSDQVLDKGSGGFTSEEASAVRAHLDSVLQKAAASAEGRPVRVRTEFAPATHQQRESARRDLSERLFGAGGAGSMAAVLASYTDEHLDIHHAVMKAHETMLASMDPKSLNSYQTPTINSQLFNQTPKLSSKL